MKAGDTVVCRASSGYRFTEGKEYTVIKYEPRTPDHNFTWPAYIHVSDDAGETAVCHASRFEVVA